MPARLEAEESNGARTGTRFPVIRHLWIWLMLQLEAFDNCLIALDDDVH